MAMVWERLFIPELKREAVAMAVCCALPALLVTLGLVA